MSDLELYREYKKKLKNYEYALFIISYDEATVCPKKDKENSLNVQNYFYEEIIKITNSDEYYELLKRLQGNKELSQVEAMAIAKEYEEITKQRRIPVDVITLGMRIQNEASLAWEEARSSLDYSIFEEKLVKLVDYEKNCYISLPVFQRRLQDLLPSFYQRDAPGL